MSPGKFLSKDTVRGICIVERSRCLGVGGRRGRTGSREAGEELCEAKWLAVGSWQRACISGR